ncbi:MAG: hypothetical protein BWY67_01260 [Bacteroidetes bacterium ADurb.Bin397]|nr:MAG: hypothetical protein BWY67_01260 [Bacteroidetes bacterium ADurb.Bin397]
MAASAIKMATALFNVIRENKKRGRLWKGSQPLLILSKEYQMSDAAHGAAGIRILPGQPFHNLLR